MKVLVIGGTGTLGEYLLPKLVADPGVSRIRVMSRNEHKQIWLNEELKSDKIDWFLGDVRDRDRVWLASRDVDLVYHLAAIKSIDKAEYNPNEAILTNIEGTRNVIDACIKNDVKTAVFTSTDKAADPYNIYGASKLVAEKLWIQSNNYSTDKGTNFVAVRYGNVIGSNGSVIQKWCNTAREKGEIFLINSDMTRFWMSGDMAANLVMAASKLNKRKITLIPKLKGTSMGVFARAFLSAVYGELGKVYIKNMQARGAEKLHETLVSQNEAAQCVEVKDLEHYPERCYMRFSDDIPVPTFKRYLSFSGLSSDKAQMWNPDDLEKEISEAIYGQPKS